MHTTIRSSRATRRLGAALAMLCLAAGRLPTAPPAAGSVLIGCDQASNRVTVTVTSHLDPTCTYTGGFDITASDVTLDCQGATIAAPRQRGGAGIRPHPGRGRPRRRHGPQLPRRGLPQQHQGDPRRVPDPADEARSSDHPTTDIVIEHIVVHRLPGRRHLRRRLRQRRDHPRQRRSRAPAAAASTWRPAPAAASSSGNQIVDNGYSENGPDGSRTSSRASTSGSGASAARASRSTAPTRTRSAATSSPATRPAASSSTRTAASTPTRPATSSAATPPTTTSSRATPSSAGSTGCGSAPAWARTPCRWSAPTRPTSTSPLRRVVLDYADDNVVRGNALHRRHLRRAGRGRRQHRGRQHLPAAPAPTSTP